MRLSLLHFFALWLFVSTEVSPKQVATFYRGNTGTGSCGKPLKGGDTAALSPKHQLYGKPEVAPFYKAGSCGIKCTVRCKGPYDPLWKNPCRPGREVVVTIDNTCPECSSTHIDLNKSALAKIANLNIGGMIEAEFSCGDNREGTKKTTAKSKRNKTKTQQKNKKRKQRVKKTRGKHRQGKARKGLTNKRKATP